MKNGGKEERRIWGGKIKNRGKERGGEREIYYASYVGLIWEEGEGEEMIE